MLALRNPLDTAPTKTNGQKLSGLLGEAAPPPVTKDVGGRQDRASRCRRRRRRQRRPSLHRSRRSAAPSAPRKWSVENAVSRFARPGGDRAPARVRYARARRRLPALRPRAASGVAGAGGRNRLPEDRAHGGPVDGAVDGLRRHAHRHHESRSRRRGRRPAARNPRSTARRRARSA